MQFEHLTKDLLLHAAELIADEMQFYMCCAISTAVEEAGLSAEYDPHHPARLEFQKYILLENDIELSGHLQTGLVATQKEKQEYRIMFLLFAAEAYFGE